MGDDTAEAAKRLAKHAAEYVGIGTMAKRAEKAGEEYYDQAKQYMKRRLGRRKRMASKTR